MAHRHRPRCGEEQLSANDERDEVQVAVNVTMRPQEAQGCLKECWEVNVGPIRYERCKHVKFEGKKPGPG